VRRNCAAAQERAGAVLLVALATARETENRRAIVAALFGIVMAETGAIGDTLGSGGL